MQFYGDTVKKMALKQFTAGSPLRTLCLLIAGQLADVFSNVNTQSSLASSVNMFQQPAQVINEFNSFYVVTYIGPLTLNTVRISPSQFASAFSFYYLNR